MNSAMSIEDIRTLLIKFQAGYARRDLNQLDEFMHLFVDSDEVEVIGINAIQPGVSEWCRGPAMVRQLVAGDWEHWGDVVFDLDGVNIHVSGDVAWIATTGTVTDRISREERYSGYLEYVQEVLSDTALDAQAKMLEIFRLGNDIVTGLPLSEIFTWPFRFTAVALHQAGEWRFHQMQFSFATTRAPDVRWGG
jgi:hypothetical protein